MRAWKVTMRHDGGTVALITAASTSGEAASLVCAMERAPLRSVVSVEPVEVTASSESFALISGGVS